MHIEIYAGGENGKDRYHRLLCPPARHCSCEAIARLVYHHCTLDCKARLLWNTRQALWYLRQYEYE